MDNSIASIEKNVIETLNRLSCPITKAICNVESSITIRNILIDQSFKNEKLNLFIWLITKFESQLALEFVDSDYLEIDIKTKKVLDALNLIGIIDANQYNVEKFHQINGKNYKELLLIIENFVRLVDFKLKQCESLFDNLTLTEKSSKTTTEMHDFDEQLSNNDQKYEIFNNLNFIREFRQSISPYQTLIPNDINLFLKANNLHQLNTAKTDDGLTRITGLRTKVSDLETQLNASQTIEIENTKQQSECSSSSSNKSLINELKEEFTKSNSLIEDFNSLMESLKCSEELIALEEDEEKENSLNIEEFYGLNKKFQQIQHSIINVSNLIESSKYNHDNITKLLSSSSILNSISSREIYDSETAAEDPQLTSASNEIGKKIKTCLNLLDNNNEVNLLDQFL